MCKNHRQTRFDPFQSLISALVVVCVHVATPIYRWQLVLYLVMTTAQGLETRWDLFRTSSSMKPMRQNECGRVTGGTTWCRAAMVQGGLSLRGGIHASKWGLNQWFTQESWGNGTRQIR